MTRPLPVLVAALTLVAGSFGLAGPVVAAVPTANPDSAVVQQDAGATTIDVLANDTITAGDLVTGTTAPSHGTAAPALDGLSVTYTPTAGYHGPDSFDYTVTNDPDGGASATVTIDVNAPPTATDDSATVLENSAANAIDVLANDTFAPDTGETLMISAKTDGAKGTVAITGGATGLSYAPKASAFGADSFTYTIDDSNGGTATATVNILIDRGPVAVADSADVQKNAGATAIAVLANDTDADNDTLTITAKTDGGNGTVAIVDGTSVTYKPDHNAVGPDSFTYTVSDGNGGTDIGTVTVFINRPPVANTDSPTILEDAGATPINVLGNDTDPDAGTTLMITDKTDGSLGAVAITGGGTGLTYTPNANANGLDSFTYTISDGHGGTDTATVNMTITAVDDAPVALDDDAPTITEDQPGATTIDVLANDTDVENDTLTVTDKTNGAKGVVTIVGGGTGVTYKPNANAFGTDTFTYTVSDGTLTTIGSVHVTIDPVNDPPNAVNDGVPTPIKVWLGAGATAIPVLANDTYLPDAPETLTITHVTQGGHGSVAITGSGTGLTYKPTGTATGIDVFTYTISDGTLTDTASVQVNVARDSSAPTAAILSIQKATIPGRTGLRIYVHWSLSDSGSGIKSELFQRRTDSGSWITVSLPSVTTRTVSLALARGHAYTFRVRATDKAGNVGAFATRLIHI